jgi:hypothetical protein
MFKSPFSYDCQFSAASGRLLQLAAVFDDAQEIALLHDQEILAVDFHLGPRPFAEQDPIPGLHIERDQLALLIPRAGARGDNLAFLRLLLCGVGNDDAAGGFLLGIDAGARARGRAADGNAYTSSLAV